MLSRRELDLREASAPVNLILPQNVCQMNKWLCIHRELIIINLSVGKQTSITSGTGSTGQKLTRSYVDVHFNECTFQAHPSCEKSDGGTCDSGFGYNDLRRTNFRPIDRDMLVT